MVARERRRSPRPGREGEGAMADPMERGNRKSTAHRRGDRRLEQDGEDRRRQGRSPRSATEVREDREARREVQGARREQRLQGRRPVEIVETRPMSKDKRWRVAVDPREARRRSRRLVMIQMQTILDVADNSGAKKCSASRCWAARAAQYASIGDVIVVSVKEAIPQAKVKKGEVARPSSCARAARSSARTAATSVRRELGGPHQQGHRADRHPHLRAGRLASSAPRSS